MSRKTGDRNLKTNSFESFIEKNETYVYSEGKLKCKVCGKDLSVTPRTGIQQIKAHEKTKVHIENYTYKITTRRSENEEIFIQTVHKEFVKLMLSLNVPLSVIDNPDFIKFFKFYFNFDMMTSETYRKKFLDIIEKEEREKAFKQFVDSPFAIYFDETTDVRGKYILSIMGRPLNGNTKNSILLDILELDKTNSDNILCELRFILPKLIGSREQRNNFMFLLTDGAPYCLKVGRILKEEYSNLKHIVCACHNLNLLGEKIRNMSPIANEFVTLLKRTLRKNKTNIHLYSTNTSLPMIKFPIITRWGSFIKCCNFISQNLQEISKFISCLSTDYNRIKELLIKEDLISELKFVSDHLFIADAILKLETDGLTIQNQMKVLENVNEQIFESEVMDRFNEILSKNVDLFHLMHINDIDFQEKIRYLNITTVEVERGFSFLNNLLSDHRHSIASKNIYKYLVCKFNK